MKTWGCTRGIALVLPSLLAALCATTAQKVMGVWVPEREC